jgi:internalin A
MSLLRATPLAVFGLATLLALAACDEPSKSAAPSGSGAPSAAVVAPVPAPSPTPSPAPTPAPRKEVICSKDPVVTFEDKGLETVVRRQLQKPTGPIQRAELSKVRTLDLSQAAQNDALDPCLFPAFTGVKGLYLAPGKLDDLTPLKTLTQIESLRISMTQVRAT